MVDVPSNGVAESIDDVCELLDRELEQSDHLIALLRNTDLKTPLEREEQCRSLRQRLRVCDSLAQVLDKADLDDPSFERVQGLLRRFFEDYVNPDERYTRIRYPVAHLRRLPPQMHAVELA